jgi:hypothetical protein
MSELVRTESANSVFPARLERAKDLTDIFEVVKEAVRVQMGISRAGLMLGLADLGGDNKSFVGGLYPVTSNIIVMNKSVLNRIMVIQPDLYKSYAFHVLLHEYIHAIGILDEEETRRRAYSISVALFGKEHKTTYIAEDISRVLPFFTYAEPKMDEEQTMDIELVKGFDRSSVNYIN